MRGTRRGNEHRNRWGGSFTNYKLTRAIAAKKRIEEKKQALLFGNPEQETAKGRGKTEKGG